MDKKIYVECDCTSLDHTIRMWYLENENDKKDNYFIIEYRVNKWLTSRNGDYSYYGPFNWKMKLRNFCLYIKTIKDAILGRPIYATSDTILSKKEALKLSKFIENNLKG